MRVLLSTFGSFGDVNPFIALGVGLRTRGHDAGIAAPEYYRDLIEREGLSFHPMRPDADLRDRELLKRVMHPKKGIGFLIEQVLLPALRQSHADLLDAAQGCDVLVTHPLVYAGPIVAEQTGLPWASCALSPLPFMSTHDPPILSPLQSMAWLRHGGRWPNAALFRLGRLAVRTWVAPIRKLRKELKLPRGKNPFFEGQFSPQLVLALFSPTMGAIQPDWPVNTVQPGFLMYDGSHGSGGLSSDVKAFLDNGPPPVVMTLGTSSVSSIDGFFEAGVEGIRELGLRVVTVGDVGEGHSTRIHDPHILRVESVPFLQLFPRASIIVHTGGVGTLAMSLLAGRPSLVVPVAHDQPDNAARLVRLGVARSIPPRHFTALRVGREIERLSEPDFSRRAANLSRVVAAEDGVNGTCEALEGLYRPVLERRR